MNVSVIIPTLNAADELPLLLDSLRAQTRPPDEIIVVDSQSADGSAALARAAGATVLEIARSEFDHGGTRDSALRQSCGDVVIFMTQDALPTDAQAVERLLAPFSDPRVAAVGGRQIARESASAYEKLTRAHNYPQESRVWDAQAIARMGVRAFMISDVFAAYRRDAYLAAGGFDHPILTNEDMLMVQKLLDAGHRIAYAGDARVLHSHNFTLRQQFRRNYIVGRTMERYRARFSGVQELGTGTKLAADVLAKLLRRGQVIDAARFALDCAARLLGNRLGKWRERRES